MLGGGVSNWIQQVSWLVPDLFLGFIWILQGRNTDIRNVYLVVMCWPLSHLLAYKLQILHRYWQPPGGCQSLVAFPSLYIALVNIYYVYLPKAVGVCNNNLPCCYFYLHVIGKHYGVSIFRGCPSKIIQCNVKVKEIHQISYAMYMCQPSYNSDVNCPPTYQRKILQIISKISLLTCLKC